MTLKERIQAVGWDREWIIILVSVALALLVWLLTNLAQEYSGPVSVPVKAVCNIDGHGTESSNTVVVSARCRTNGFRLMREFSRRERKIVKVRFDRADLRRTGPDTYAVIGGAKNSYVNQFFGDGAQVEAFITDTLRFVFPVENNKKVPVEVPRSLYCRSQYMLGGPFRVMPDSVTVYGDDAHLATIEKITTPRLSLMDLHETAQGVLSLNVPKEVRLSEGQVSYEVPVTRYVELRTTVPIEVWNAPAGHQLQVFPPTASVVLRCVFPIGKDPLPAFKLYVDWKDFNASLTGRCAARTLRLPPGVLEYRVEPEVFDCIELR
ncbi:MAG: hypothetical protein J6M31_05575 [Bacteroidales bacterium]|nr:hypothetical protein [Bacteroidales bacterium]